MTVRVKIYAKLNLTLDVSKREGDYHLLDSVVTSIDTYDLIVAKSRKDGKINIVFKGLGAEYIPENNNAKKAGEKYSSTFGGFGADITIYRNIPVGAGLGSSSADAAGVIKALALINKNKDTVALKRIADELGSDTGYMLFGGFCRMKGRGNYLMPLEDNGNKWYFLIFDLGEGCSTKECFNLFDEIGESTQNTDEFIREYQENGVTGACKHLSNDLKTPAEKLVPNIKTAISEAESFSPCGVNMTGSGSTVYAVFETKEMLMWAYSRYKGKFKVYYAESVKGDTVWKKE